MFITHVFFIMNNYLSLEKVKLKKKLHEKILFIN